MRNVFPIGKEFTLDQRSVGVAQDARDRAVGGRKKARTPVIHRKIATNQDESRSQLWKNAVRGSERCERVKLSLAHATRQCRNINQRLQAEPAVKGAVNAEVEKLLAGRQSLDDEVAEADDIAPFVVDALRTQTGIDAIVLLPGRDGTFESAAGTRADIPLVPPDDAMLAALRAEREPVRASAWAGPAAVAFPMLIRGRLRGVLICRTRDGEELAPDESEALFAVAREMAGARDDLLAESLREKFDVLEFGSTR